MTDRALHSPRVASPPATGSSSARPSLSPLRHRPLGRAATASIGEMTSSAGLTRAPSSSSLPRRRSSFMTVDSLDRASLRSSTDSLFLPRVSRHAASHDNEPSSEGSSHLHSIPLALALLPAVGGLLFKNGSQVLTDVTLLVLAAIFLNWSVRLPWDWYHSAQVIRIQEEEDAAGLAGMATDEDGYTSPLDDTIVEEDDDYNEGNGAGRETGRVSRGGAEGEGGTKADDVGGNVSPSSPPAAAAAAATSDSDPARVHKHHSALRELRVHELLALLACFASPILGAWLLHYIRGSLSRPSEGLVSDYNLSIFLLAAELRPLSHLLRMIQSRTLHLQRVVAHNPFTTASPAANRLAVQDLQTRLDELEADIASRAANGIASGSTGGSGANGLALGALDKEQQRTFAKSIEATLRASLQPEIDAVTRATRRYEKRATLLGLQTEARLNALEGRVQDAVTLAAGAERAQQAHARGGVRRLLDAGAGAGSVVSTTLAEVMWGIVRFPVRLGEAAFDTVAWVFDGTVGRLLPAGLKLGGKEAGRREGRGGARRAGGWIGGGGKVATAAARERKKKEWMGKEQAVEGMEWSFGSGRKSGAGDRRRTPRRAS